MRFTIGCMAECFICLIGSTRLRYVLQKNAHTTYKQKDVCVTGSHGEENLSNWSMMMGRCALRKIMMRHAMNK